jgi:hypothetical protein
VKAAVTLVVIIANLLLDEKRVTSAETPTITMRSQPA